MFYIEGREDKEYELLADAAQDAEFLHAEKDRRYTVRNGAGEVCYESEGAPE